MFVVLTHHKFASSWLSVYLKSYCELNGISFCENHKSDVFPDQSDVLLLRNADYRFIRSRITSAVHVVRNPLDVIVSAYHSHRATHPLDNWPALQAQRQVLNSVNKDDGMHLTLSFLERDDFYRGAVGPLHALRHWDYDDDRILTVRMEDIVLAPDQFFVTQLEGKQPDYEAFSFEALAGRPRGKIDDGSHYRAGVPDCWRVELPTSVIAYVRAHYADVMRRYYPESLCDVDSRQQLRK